MNATASERGKKILVPEVIQTSGMDCGPATLSALLGGWGLQVSFGRLREACQTDLDGTSIDKLEDIARQLGLDAEQVVIPREHIFLDFAESLPAIVVVRRPTGAPHFVVCWRRHGDLVQIMDPASGRRFLRTTRFTEDLFVHSQRVAVDKLEEWLAQEGFQLPLYLRLRRLGLSHAIAEGLLETARKERRWQYWARLDAAVRMLSALVASSAIERGREAHRLLEAVVKNESGEEEIPQTHWSMEAATRLEPVGDEDEDREEIEEVILRGAVLVMIRGKLAEDAAQAAERMAGLSEDLRAAISEPPARPLRTLINLLPGSERRVAALNGLGVMAAAGLLVGLDALFRSTLHMAWYTRNALHRLMALTVGLVFVIGVCGVVLLLTQNAIRLGRYLEVRLRAVLFAKLPQLNDRYFQTRPVSDMAERAHNLHVIRQILLLGSDGVRAFGTAILTALALSFFVPRQRLLVLAILAVAVGVPLLLPVFLVELDLRVRTYVGSLTKLFLDALIGLSPVRTHGGERAFTRSHEELLAGWARTRMQALQLTVGLHAVRLLLGFSLIGWLVMRYLGDGGNAAGLLLVFYWAFGLPAAGADLSQSLLLYPDIRNVTLRLIEPLGAPSQTAPLKDDAAPTKTEPVDVIILGVSVVVAGQTVLREVTIDIPAGSHVAVVGASGAGKSTIIGLLLGFHKAASGQILLDGLPAEMDDLLQLRQQVAWVDPDIKLWNRSLFDNLHNGHPDDRPDALSGAIATADLIRVMARLPKGLATPLGEGGRLLSGGEGQRVRLGRTLLQPAPRLVLLDEPFRGLDRDHRLELLRRVRKNFEKTTLVYVSHDIESTLSFSKVLVVENGHIVESADPQTLRKDETSRYAAMLKAEAEVRRDLWSAGEWQRLRMVDGQLVKEEAPNADSEEN